MGKGVNFADADDAKENYIMTANADEANCVEVYQVKTYQLYILKGCNIMLRPFLFKNDKNT
jgi:hypothetical protein